MSQVTITEAEALARIVKAAEATQRSTYAIQVMLTILLVFGLIGAVIGFSLAAS